MWGWEPWQQWKNFSGIIVLQFVAHLPSGYGTWFYCDCARPTVLLWLLHCLWTWAMFFGIFQHLPVSVCSAGSCDFGALARDKHTSFYCVILNWKLPFGRFLITLSVLILVISPFVLFCFSQFSLRRLYISKNLSISSRLLILLAYSCL